ncbi:MAG: replicative DNA helicase [Ruminococcus sp.]|jgi:replicative DNA helicase|nr:replicative DNA helicase [Ruminococcus sp.]
MDNTDNRDSYSFGSLTDYELPHSVEAEQAVIGGILLFRDNISAALLYLTADSFYIKKHRLIFDIIVNQFTIGSDSDVVTVLNEAVAQKIFESAGVGREYLTKIRELVTVSTSIESYCRIVRDKYYLRQIISAADKMNSTAREQTESAEDIIDYAESLIYNIRNGRNIDGLTPIREVLTDAYSDIQAKSGPEREKYIAGTTGYRYLDKLIFGLNKSDLLILAGRPGMGKSALALNFAVNFCDAAPEKAAVIFSLEMSKEQLATRMLSSRAYVDSRALQTGNVDNSDWEKLAEAVGYLRNLDIYLDDTAGITVPQMKAKLRRLNNVGCVIIDYLQLMNSSRRIENRVNEISEITRQLKLMAKELDVPIITLSQLSRAVESRTDKRPILADLRESGSIEQDADIVMFIYRDGYYNKLAADLTLSECIVAKNRHGETGMVPLRWNGQYTLFLPVDNNNYD